MRPCQKCGEGLENHVSRCAACGTEQVSTVGFAKAGTSSDEGTPDGRLLVYGGDDSEQWVSEFREIIAWGTVVVCGAVYLLLGATGLAGLLLCTIALAGAILLVPGVLG